MRRTLCTLLMLMMASAAYAECLPSLKAARAAHPVEHITWSHGCYSVGYPHRREHRTSAAWGWEPAARAAAFGTGVVVPLPVRRPMTIPPPVTIRWALSDRWAMELPPVNERLADALWAEAAAVRIARMLAND